LFKRDRRDINGMGSTIFVFPVDISVDLSGKGMGRFQYFTPGAYGLDIFRANLYTGRDFAFFKAVIAPVTFIHDTISGKGRQQVKIKPDAGLSLRDVPGTGFFTF
jgi:hypothetical protein